MIGGLLSYVHIGGGAMSLAITAGLSGILQIISTPLFKQNDHTSVLLVMGRSMLLYIFPAAVLRVSGLLTDYMDGAMIVLSTSISLAMSHRK